MTKALASVRLEGMRLALCLVLVASCSPAFSEPPTGSEAITEPTPEAAASKSPSPIVDPEGGPVTAVSVPDGASAATEVDAGGEGGSLSLVADGGPLDAGCERWVGNGDSSPLVEVPCPPSEPVYVSDAEP
jgi:hypothetical protein